MRPTGGSPGAPRRARVLVVDDSVVVRRLVTNALTGDPAVEVVGAASSGRLALERIAQLSPDVVTLDIEMPDLDGLATLSELRRRHPGLPVIMFSSLTDHGAAATLDALALGADDYVTKPSGAATVDQALADVRDQLLPKIKALCSARGVVLPADNPAARPSAPGTEPLRLPVRGRARPPLGSPISVVAIAASTGGPDALATVFAGLPAGFPVPVVVVQHMPPVFTRMFAQRLNLRSGMDVIEAEGGEAVVPGHAYVAPGDYHLAVRRDGPTVRTVVQREGPENYVRPAADVLFRSVADVYADRTLAVVLTGMGSDGTRGCERLAAAGARIVVQDAATSVVWGMPGSVAQAGLADDVLPLPEVASFIVRAVESGVSPVRSGIALGARP